MVGRLGFESEGVRWGLRLVVRSRWWEEIIQPLPKPTCVMWRDPNGLMLWTRLQWASPCLIDWASGGEGWQWGQMDEE